MINILKYFKNNEAFKAFDAQSHDLGNLNAIEEILMIANSYHQHPRNLIIVKNNLYAAQQLYEGLSPLLKSDVLLFGAEESLRIDAIAASPEMQAARLESLHTIINRETTVCITHIGALLSYLPSPLQFRTHCLDLQINDEIGFEELKTILFEAGYQRTTYVDQPLTFASRGGIIDVFSLNYDLPLRIEFFDDVVDSIRFFDIASRKTIKHVNEATIIPADDILFDDEQKELINQQLDLKYQKYSGYEATKEAFNAGNENHRNRIFYSLIDDAASLSDYFNDSQIIFSGYEAILNHYRMINEENIAYIQELVSVNQFIPIFTLNNDIYTFADKAMPVHEFVSSKHPILSGIETTPVYDVPLERRLAFLDKLSQDYQVIVSVNDAERQLIQQCGTYNFAYESIPLNEGFIANNEKIALYTSKELFDTVHLNKRFANKFRDAQQIDNYLQLQKGDFIVHKLYGVGKYLGIETRTTGGIHKDYLKIAYKGDDLLFVPLEQFRLVRKFVSKEGMTPKLNTLGGSEWKKTREKVSADVKELADRLVKLYALRENNIGFAFHKDDEMQKAFEHDFAYELTHDQKQALKEIKKDMEADSPMDRLLCGDVGFGKTEVALIAAFKAISDNKQVAFLCPTTILSFQHFKTAVDRFKNYAVNIKVVNRFVSSAQITKIKHDLKAGRIDLLIGTHRLLSKDMQFKDLGLLIIDEEQRFGVEHKERIKELKSGVDVLSLSATPIPRTLQMSLVGIRSLSQLNTAPNNRVSVQTYVVEKDERLIKEVIQRELSRKGQVFYLYNNVSEIYNVANQLAQKLPKARIGIAHGQMGREEIEDVMLKFTEKAYDILVCTTIIETGIDIPNANTIIIDNADRFGLSQLYQIKGRVGRSDRLAYAYLMYAPHKQLSEIATKRLRAMKEFAKLGSGYKIALRDLTIRGAGELLGPKQAGFIDTVGMDMYIELLNDAIAESKGEVKKIKAEQKRTNIKVDAYIPKKFQDEDYEKITLYQEIDKVMNFKQLDALISITRDNYGKLPKEVALLFQKKRLDLLVNQPGVETFIENPKDVKVVFTKKWSDGIDGVKLFELANRISKDLIIRYSEQKIQASLIKDSNYLDVMIEFIHECEKMEKKCD